MPTEEKDWRRRDGVEPSAQLTPRNSVLKTGAATGPHPSPQARNYLAFERLGRGVKAGEKVCLCKPARSPREWLYVRRSTAYRRHLDQRVVHFHSQAFATASSHEVRERRSFGLPEVKYYLPVPFSSFISSSALITLTKI